MKRSPFIYTIVLVAAAYNVISQSVPALVNYQGRITGIAAQPIAAGIYTLSFRLWDSANGPSSQLIWSQQQTVTVSSNGVFNVILGAPGGSPVSGDSPLANDLSLAFTDNTVGAHDKVRCLATDPFAQRLVS